MRWLYCTATAPFFNKPKIGNQWSVNKIGTKSRKSYLWFGLKIYRSVIHLFEHKTNSSKWFFLKVYLLHERNPQKKRVWNLPLLIFFPSQTMGVIILPMWVELYKNRFSTFFLWDFLCKQMNIYVELRIIWDKAKFIRGNMENQNGHKWSGFWKLLKHSRAKHVLQMSEQWNKDKVRGQDQNEDLETLPNLTIL